MRRARAVRPRVLTTLPAISSAALTLPVLPTLYAMPSRRNGASAPEKMRGL